MKSPSVVVFDLGKVLLDFDYSIAARSMAASSRVSARQIQDFIDHSPLLVRYEKGWISRREFFEEVQGMASYQGGFEEFCRLFSDVFTPITPMIEWRERLAAAGVRCFIFSNTNDLAISHIRATYPFYNRFDGYVVSYEHGSMKPEPRLYEEVEAATGCQGSDILYLDDRKENVDGGLRRGWTAIHHQSPQTSIETAARLGVKV